MSLSPYIDPFHGNGAIQLPETRGIAATWFFPKAQTGNTHPGACLPFGFVSACPYSGAYVTGYGLNAPNCSGKPPLRFKDYLASGFTHFQQSGTGAIGSYYNYARVTPLANGLGQLGSTWILAGETARPGWYAATLKETGIRAELTVTRRAALHRYTFPHSGRFIIAVDFSVGGLDFPEMRHHPSEAIICVDDAGGARAMIRMRGVPFYIVLRVDGGDSDACRLWENQCELPATTRTREFQFNAASQCKEPLSFGACFHANSSRPLILRMGFSLRSFAQAEKNLRDSTSRSFDEIAAAAEAEWEDVCRRIEVAGGTAEQLNVFYSCLYHSFVKPVEANGESPFHDGSEPFYADFATLWDQYKTQLPLLMTLFPERGADVVNSLLAFAERHDGFPNCLLLDSDFDICRDQARALAQHTIADAFFHRIQGIDWRRALTLMTADLRHPRNRDFLESGRTDPATHTLDMAAAAWSVARIAERLGDLSLTMELDALARRWRNVFDPTTGLLIEGRYYEGTNWNYSFRLLHDMAERIALHPRGEDGFVADLDHFFGFSRQPARQQVDPADCACMKEGFASHSFEGYNNEPDMETPYAYIYAGRHDRAAEVLRAGMSWMFTTGRGGLPGNDDSGGLSSCHVWNAIGIFPVSGQPLFLIGSPLFTESSTRVGPNIFSVKALDNAMDRPYVRSARLNGKSLDRAWLTTDEVTRGGELLLDMTSEPSKWGLHC